jgi:23S rRNA (pseudouridine1915-N3)-methyltransferase
MRIRILALGHKLPGWAATAYEEYARRMPGEARIELIELKPEVRSARTTQQVLAKEAERIELAMPKGAVRVVLDERGKLITTQELAGQLRAWQHEAAQPVFLIGSADGLDDTVKARAHQTIALSRCTLPHALVRVLLAEQLYRAWSLTANHPYHRE